MLSIANHELLLCAPSVILNMRMRCHIILALTTEATEPANIMLYPLLYVQLKQHQAKTYPTMLCLNVIQTACVTSTTSANGSCFAGVVYVHGREELFVLIITLAVTDYLIQFVDHFLLHLHQQTVTFLHLWYHKPENTTPEIQYHRHYRLCHPASNFTSDAKVNSGDPVMGACSHQLPTLTNNWICSAACEHTIIQSATTKTLTHWDAYCSAACRRTILQLAATEMLAHLTQITSFLLLTFENVIQNRQRRLAEFSCRHERHF